MRDECARHRRQEEEQPDNSNKDEEENNIQAQIVSPKVTWTKENI